MINIGLYKQDIAQWQRNKQKLQTILGDLNIEKMELDKAFSVFLSSTHHYAMQPDDLENEKWYTYKKMKSYYTKVEDLIKITNYFLRKE